MDDTAVVAGAKGEAAPRLSAPAKKPKEQSIETLRGLAILLLVVLHSHEETVPDFVASPGHARWVDYVNFAFVYLRMPLFTVISGYVYALRPLGRRGDARKFLAGKARRLVVPLVAVTTISIAFVALTSGNFLYPDALWKSYFYPYRHLWFLQAMVFVILFVSFCEWNGFMDTLYGWLACLVFAFALGLVPYRPEFFSINRFFYLLPFFIFGIGLQRYEQELRHRAVFATITTVAIVGLIIQQLGWFGVSDVSLEKGDVLGLTVGLSANYVLFMVRRPIPFLAWVGSYSYAIYLFHHIGISAGKRLFLATDGDSNDVYFFVKLAAGLSIPIVIEVVAKRRAITRRALLGLR
ncbi:MAG: acyltransferase [Myxococcota bacterium]